jgi:protein-tyrosine kinase
MREIGSSSIPLFADQDVKVLPTPSDPTTAAVITGRTLAVEELRLLVASIYALNDARPARCLGLLSASGGEGKTTISIGLASILASEPDRRVLLIDADLRKPAVEKYLGLSSSPGLSDWLKGSAGPIPLRKVTPPGFSLLSAGSTTLDRPERLGSGRMAALLEAARQSFDFVIVDCPPVTPVADAVFLQDLLDGFLFVVRARHSPRETVQRAASRLKPDRILGTVFNDQKGILPSYGSYGYRRYGEPSER